jgi:hypothetical protein
VLQSAPPNSQSFARHVRRRCGHEFALQSPGMTRVIETRTRTSRPALCATCWTAMCNLVVRVIVKTKSSEITSEVDLIGGCFAGFTDLEKSNEPHKMRAQPFLMAQHGLLPGDDGKKWSERSPAGDPSRPNVEASSCASMMVRRATQQRPPGCSSPHGEEARARVFPRSPPQSRGRSGR